MCVNVLHVHLKKEDHFFKLNKKKYRKRRRWRREKIWHYLMYYLYVDCFVGVLWFEFDVCAFVYLSACVPVYVYVSVHQVRFKGGDVHVIWIKIVLCHMIQREVDNLDFSVVTTPVANWMHIYGGRYFSKYSQFVFPR